MMPLLFDHQSRLLCWCILLTTSALSSVILSSLVRLLPTTHCQVVLNCQWSVTLGGYSVPFWFPFNQYSFIHHCIDIHAMNAEPTSALALCVLPFGLETKVFPMLWNYSWEILFNHPLIDQFHRWKMSWFKCLPAAWKFCVKNAVRWSEDTPPKAQTPLWASLSTVLYHLTGCSAKVR